MSTIEPNLHDDHAQPCSCGTLTVNMSLEAGDEPLWERHKCLACGNVYVNRMDWEGLVRDPAAE